VNRDDLIVYVGGFCLLGMFLFAFSALVGEAVINNKSSAINPLCVGVPLVFGSLALFLWLVRRFRA
jgi:hypothetical protein